MAVGVSLISSPPLVDDVASSYKPSTTPVSIKASSSVQNHQRFSGYESTMNQPGSSTFIGALKIDLLSKNPSLQAKPTYANILKSGPTSLVHLQSLKETNHRAAHPLKPISIHEGKPSIAFSVTEKKNLIGKLQFVLIAKSSHGRPPIATISKFIRNLQLKGNVNFSVFDSKHLYVECSKFEDYVMLWSKGVWIISGFPLRMFKWDDAFDPTKESAIVPVWIHLPRLPLFLFDVNALLSIANAIGRPLKIDANNINRTKLGCASVCVELDVSKSLVEEIWLTVRDDSSEKVLMGFWQKVVYGFIPQFCSACAHIGHSENSCLRRLDVKEHRYAIGIEKQAVVGLNCRPPTTVLVPTVLNRLCNSLETEGLNPELPFDQKQDNSASAGHLSAVHMKTAIGSAQEESTKIGSNVVKGSNVDVGGSVVSVQEQKSLAGQISARLVAVAENAGAVGDSTAETAVANNSVGVGAVAMDGRVQGSSGIAAQHVQDLEEGELTVEGVSTAAVVGFHMEASSCSEHATVAGSDNTAADTATTDGQNSAELETEAEPITVAESVTETEAVTDAEEGIPAVETAVETAAADGLLGDGNAVFKGVPEQITSPAVFLQETHHVRAVAGDEAAGDEQKSEANAVMENTRVQGLTEQTTTSANSWAVLVEEEEIESGNAGILLLQEEDKQGAGGQALFLATTKQERNRDKSVQNEELVCTSTNHESRSCDAETISRLEQLKSEEALHTSSVMESLWEQLRKVNRGKIKKIKKVNNGKRATKKDPVELGMGNQNDSVCTSKEGDEKVDLVEEQGLQKNRELMTKTTVSPRKLSSEATEFTPKCAAGGQVEMITSNAMEQLKERMNRLKGVQYGNPYLSDEMGDTICAFKCKSVPNSPSRSRKKSKSIYDSLVYSPAISKKYGSDTSDDFDGSWEDYD